MARMQVLMLDAARRCLAGPVAAKLAKQQTDVVVAVRGGLDRQYANALRVESSRYVGAVGEVLRADFDEVVADQAVQQLSRLVLDHVGASSHDRVGEMASSIPARIAAAFSLQGRTLAVEAAEASSHLALWHAMTCLRSGSAAASLVLAGERSEGEFADSLRRAKQNQLNGECEPQQPATITALLLKTRATALRDGDEVLAHLLECQWTQLPRSGTFRPPPFERVLDGATAVAVEGNLGDLYDLIVGMGEKQLVPGWLPGRSDLRWPPGPGGAPRRAALTAHATTGSRAEIVIEEPLPVAAGVGPPQPAGSRVRPAPAAGTRAPIAVVARGALFSQIADAEQFWEVVSGGRDALAPLPAEAFDRQLYHRPGQVRLDTSYTDLGGHVPAPQSAPPGIVIPPARYAQLDVAQRAALQVAAELFGGCRAGLPGRGLVALGSTLGLGSARTRHAHSQLHRLGALLDGVTSLAGLHPDQIAELHKLALERCAIEVPAPTANLADGVLASGAAALIANEFGLAAIPVAVEAACASALAAIDLAMHALWAGSIDYAVVGGVEFPCTERDLVLCSALGLLSGSRITPFDAAADGFTPGDGCALFLLKRLPDAVSAGDRVLGLLAGSGASNDAKSLIAPDPAGQALAMRRAFNGLDFGPHAVDYLEAHGTGTKVGDRVELEAIT
ncbi:MAG: polyketide synthase, partial [Jatrophihabitantaceae bacterium]